MSIDESQIRQYLLGAMGDAEAEQMDQRLFHEPALAEQVEAIEEELLRDYHCDQLSQGARQQLDSRLSVDPVLRSRLEEARAFSSAIIGLARPAPAERKRAAWAWLWAPGFAWAMVVLLAAMCSWLAVRGSRLERRVVALDAEKARLAAAASAAAIAPQPVQFELSPGVTLGRSDARVLRIRPPAREVRFVLDIRARIASGATLLAILQDPDGREVWSGRAAAAADHVDFTIPAQALPSGDYLLELRMASNGGADREVETYSFGVRP